jgi:hypothetical protein
MTIKRLLSGRNFAPEAVKLLTEVFERASDELKIAVGDEAARETLAKLTLEIAGPKPTLNADDLLDEVEIAWGWRNAGQCE